MDKKIALVSGANKSIGFEVVRGLAQMGMIVYLGSRNEEMGIQAANDLHSDGDVRFIQLDVSNEHSMTSAIHTIQKQHGRLDVLVNNAGIASSDSDAHNFSASNISMESVKKIFDTNFLGAVRLTQLSIPLLRQSKAGRVVNTSSAAGSFQYLNDVNSPKPFAYCTSKLALNGATIIFADELRDTGIKINAAHPGLVNSALSNNMGERTGKDGAKIIIQLATLDDNGPTGGFFDEDGVYPW
ncbi:SDR family NAD(P)-dependent oxidoreductase [Paenibacillus sp. WLX1005]|uniref:SDR family NAD(P)-dependent oxidoreductase n=1 Tax=unclassified Paenibacillus TaxID=185978 RepID=UPI0039845106